MATATESAGIRLKALKSAVSKRGSSLNATTEAKDVRIQLDEAFERDNGFSYEYVIVFKVHEENAELSQAQKDFSMRNILQRLAKGGIETKMFYSVDRDFVFCKMRASLERLCKEADRIDYKVEFDPMELRRVAEAGYPEQGIGPIRIEDTMGVSHRDPYQDFFGKYDVDDRLQHVYKKYGRRKIPLRGVDRIKLMLNIIKSHFSDGGAALNLSLLLKEKCVEAAYPLHNYEELNALKEVWLRWSYGPSAQPLRMIKDYFGEKVGLYFAWLGHYTWWLMLPSFLGCLLMVDVFIEKEFDTRLLPYYGLFMALWSTFYYEYWKRYNSRLALEWGMTTFEEEEVDRPEYEGEEIASPIDGSKIRYFNPHHRFQRMMWSLLVIFFLISAVIAAVASIFLFRYVSTAKEGPLTDFFTISGVNIGGPAASTLNAVQIMVMNTLYGGVADRLNNYENHRTDTEFEDNLIAKTFLFQFVNSYASLFYIAFIKGNMHLNEEGCPVTGCMDELAMALGFIFVIRLTSGNFFEIGLPWIQHKLRAKLRKSKGNDELVKNAVAREPSPIEEQMKLDLYDAKGTFDDYNEMIIQFGYVTLFVVAFPIAPALALLNNYFEIRIDAAKLVHNVRRPDPRGGQDIGTWGTIIEIMSMVSVVTNVALVVFTSISTTEHLTTGQRLWVFLGLEHALILLKYVLQMVVDDEPHDVQLQKQRIQFITDKVVNLIADDDDEALAKGNQVRVDLTVFDHDI